MPYLRGPTFYSHDDYSQEVPQPQFTKFTHCLEHFLGRKVIRKKSERMAEALDEFFIPITSTLQTIGHVELPSGNEIVGVTGLGHLRGIFDLFSGLNLIMDEKSHHQKKNKLKGAALLFSSAQIFTFSYTPWSVGLALGAMASPFVFGPASLAMAAAIDLAFTSMDYYYHSKKFEFDFWLKEEVALWNHLQKRLYQLEKKQPPEGAITKKQWELMEEYEECLHDAQLVRKNIEVRCWMNCGKAEVQGSSGNETTIMQIRENLKKLAPAHPKLAAVVNKDKFFDEIFLQDTAHPFFLHRNKKYMVDGCAKTLNQMIDSKMSNPHIQARELKLKAFIQHSHQQAGFSVIRKSLIFAGCLCLTLALVFPPSAVIFGAAGIVFCSSALIFHAITERKMISHNIKKLAKKIKNKCVKDFRLDDKLVPIYKPI